MHMKKWDDIDMEINILTFLACICFLFLIGRIFILPIKWILKLVFNSILGGILILAINFIGGLFALHISINIVTCIVVGFLGIPGAIVLLLISFIWIVYIQKLLDFIILVCYNNKMKRTKEVMKKIYIILTHTGTILSNIIKTYTKDEYSHVSISLDEELKEMYSFGRLNPYNAFIGGFIHEKIDEGTFKRFKKTQAKMYSLMIEDNQYEKIENKIKEMEQEKETYKFNIYGLFAVSIHKKIKAPRTFYCAEFVKYILDEAGIKVELPEIIRPENFKSIPNMKLEYVGLLKNYKKDKNT